MLCDTAPLIVLLGSSEQHGLKNNVHYKCQDSRAAVSFFGRYCIFCDFVALGTSSVFTQKI